ncbi:MAG: hypothetical protein J7J01_01205 [Methanophagales archaeon]|nr:hypothetical protein [Methanophagales archaeon]
MQEKIEEEISVVRNEMKKELDEKTSELLDYYALLRRHTSLKHEVITNFLLFCDHEGEKAFYEKGMQLLDKYLADRYKEMLRLEEEIENIKIERTLKSGKYTIKLVMFYQFNADADAFLLESWEEIADDSGRKARHWNVFDYGDVWEGDKDLVDEFKEIFNRGIRM